MPPNPQQTQRSLLAWMIEALGPLYAVLLPLAALVCFALSLILVLRGKGPMAIAALLLVVPIPMLIAIVAALQGAINVHLVMATSESAPKPSAVAEGISTTLVAALSGMLCMVPSFVVATLGAFVRAMVAGKTSSGVENR